MINFLRKHTKLIFWAIVIVLVPSFVMWGAGRGGFFGGRRRKMTIARFSGEKISSKEFRTHWDAAHRLLRGEENLTYELVENATWQRIMLVKEADRWGVWIPSNEVKRYIRRTFQDKNGFNRGYYRNALKKMGVSAPDFESEVRDTLKMQKLAELVAGSATVTPREVRD
ncbi:MAG: SurA N-terminal domain-containing protein, partial [Thermoplasmata archaeon]|nr:SurA N-terminal domain-containing protein [Thermoplasmata archaeon]